MLFDENSKTFPPELLEQLKGKAREISRVLREAREENQALKSDLAAAQEDLSKAKAILASYDSERGELKTIVEELLREFEQVAR